MLYTKLGSSGLQSSVLGFGCSPLLGRVGRRDSLRALEAAWDLGITFYDTARSYGYGECETLLGEFLRGKREQAVISTKFGIVAAPQTAWKEMAKPLVRGVLAVAPSLRTLVRRAAVDAQFEKGQFTIPVLQRSIEASLRKLGTSYVDVLFLHAAPASVLGQDDLLEEMGKLVTAGKVRAAGISAEPDVIALALERRVAPLSAMQFPCNIFDPSMTRQAAGAKGVFFVANHPFGGVTRVAKVREWLKQLAVSPDTPSDICRRLGAIDDRTLAEVVLNMIVQGTGIHVVLPAMAQVRHLQANVQAMLEPRLAPDDIRWLRDQLNGEPVEMMSQPHGQRSSEKG